MPIVEKINELETEISKLTDSELRGKTEYFKKELENGKDAPLFKTVFYENNQMGEAAEYQAISTLRQKWGYQGQYDRLEKFTQEVLDRME